MTEVDRKRQGCRTALISCIDLRTSIEKSINAVYLTFATGFEKLLIQVV